MKDTDFIIALEHIPPEGLRLRATVEEASAVGIELAVPQDGPMGLDVEVEAVGRRILVRGEIEVPVRLGCSRCLRGYLHTLQGSFEVFLHEGEGESAAGDHELSPEEIEIQTFTGGVVDLRALITEQAHLALPVKPLCAEDCKGLCPGCGKDRNGEACNCETVQGDPRWEPLKKLKA